MYIPAYVKKQLTTPESLAFESDRRGLKATLSNAREAVRNHRLPTLPREAMNVTEAREHEKYLDNRNRLPRMIRINGKQENVEEARARHAARYALYVDHCTTKYKSQKLREQLINAVEVARKEYEDFLNQTKPSDLE